MDNHFENNEEQTVKCSCPECGASIYDISSPCPKCGYPAGDLKNHYEEQEKRKEKEKMIDKEEKRKASDEFHKELSEAIEKGHLLSKEKYEVDPAAEQIINTIAKSILLIGWVVGLILAIGGAVLASDGGFGSELYYLGIPLGIGILLIAYVSWAQLKMLVNISHTLYNINDAVRGR